MNFLTKLRLSLFAAALSAALSAAGQNLVKDGDFEQAMGSGPYTTYNPGQTIDGVWSVTQSGGPIVVDKTNAIHGTSIQLPGPGALGATILAGSIQQTLATIPGQTYTIAYNYANYSQVPRYAALHIGFGDSTRTSLVSLSGPTPYSFTATATSASTVLSFGGVDSTTAYVFIDDVSVQAVPEPSALAALGLGAIALVRRRRKA